MHNRRRIIAMFVTFFIASLLLASCSEGPPSWVGGIKNVSLYINPNLVPYPVMATYRRIAKRDGDPIVKLDYVIAHVDAKNRVDMYYFPDGNWTIIIDGCGRFYNTVTNQTSTCVRGKPNLTNLAPVTQETQQEFWKQEKKKRHH